MLGRNLTKACNVWSNKKEQQLSGAAWIHPEVTGIWRNSSKYVVWTKAFSLKSLVHLFQLKVSKNSSLKCRNLLSWVACKPTSLIFLVISKCMKISKAFKLSNFRIESLLRVLLTIQIKPLKFPDVQSFPFQLKSFVKHHCRTNTSTLCRRKFCSKPNKQVFVVISLDAFVLWKIFSSKQEKDVGEGCWLNSIEYLCALNIVCLAFPKLFLF